MIAGMPRLLAPLLLPVALAACCACVEPPAQVAAVPVYCYQTLGDVDCYDRPDPQQRD